MGERKLAPPILNFGTKLDMSGQLHAQANLSPGTHLIGVGWTIEPIPTFSRSQKSLAACRKSKDDPSVVHPIS
jgi:hypothetical protein